MEEKAEPLSSPLASAFVTADIRLRTERVEHRAQLSGMKRAHKDTCKQELHHCPEENVTEVPPLVIPIESRGTKKMSGDQLSLFSHKQKGWILETPTCTPADFSPAGVWHIQRGSGEHWKPARFTKNRSRSVKCTSLSKGVPQP